MGDRYLFVDWEGGGNLPPALTLARQMVERGHRVRVLCDPADEADVRAAGCKFVPYTRAPTAPTSRQRVTSSATGRRAHRWRRSPARRIA